MKTGASQWWDVVTTSPLHEAEYMLRSYKSALLAAHPVGSPGYCDAGMEIQRVNEWIHRIGQVQNRARITQAIRNVCGQEVFVSVMEETARLENEARLSEKDLARAGLKVEAAIAASEWVAA